MMTTYYVWDTQFEMLEIEQRTDRKGFCFRVIEIQEEIFLKVKKGNCQIDQIGMQMGMGGCHIMTSAKQKMESERGQKKPIWKGQQSSD